MARMFRKNERILSIINIILVAALTVTDPITAFARTGEEAQTAAKTVRLNDTSGESREEIMEDEEAVAEEEADKERKEGLFKHEDGESEKSKATPVERMDITEMTEIRIGSFEEWEQFVKNCTLDSWSKDKYVVLTKDIDCNMQKFTPVPLFSGVFDGNDHTINKAAFTEEVNYIGIFSKTGETAVIRNVSVIGVMKPGGKAFNVGGIVGDNWGMIANCRYDGYVDGYDYVGGIAGFNEPTGVISACRVTGKVTGLHYVGGITGSNTGLVTGCDSDADINTVTKEVETGLSDIKVEEVFTSLLNLGREDGNKKSIHSTTNPVDIGGISGNNTGEISSCHNKSKVGYEHVGYNVGGIVGRQSGYVHDCSNEGRIRGRKDVGGIVGQAEPYIRLDLSSDIIAQISTAINNLHDSVDATIKDTDSSAGVVSARLDVIKGFADKALSDTGYLANSTQDFVNGVVGSTNEVVSRIEYVMSETSKSDGALDDVSKAGSHLRDAAKDLEEVAHDLNIDNYLDDEETKKYEEAKKNLKSATEEYDTYFGKNYEHEYKKHYAKIYYKKLKGTDYAGPNEYPNDAEIEQAETDARAAGKTDEEIKTFREESKGEAAVLADIDAAVDAEEEYAQNHGGHSYPHDVKEYTNIIATTILDNADDMVDDAEEDTHDSLENVKKMAGDLRDAGSSLRSVISEVANKPSVRFPELSDEYRMHTNSLVFNIQGMSDNLGYLNSEMRGATGAVCDDLEGVNDKFQTLMLLFTDAMDGALDMDYSEVFQDESNDVCYDSVDATVADCENKGHVYADINTGGIAGTMAQEYDFDLESDITGIKDSSKNSTYRTKCVLRRNTNRGEIKGKKSYVGGACGLHEIGTILGCKNFAKVSSESSDYVGVIAGRSYSTIRDSYEKGLLGGGSYIGGIAGAGVDISNCVAMPTVTKQTNFAGAIEGEGDESGKLKGNVFVSDTLAGVDRVSMEGAAEPVSYSSLLAMEDIPSDFKMMKVSFIVGDKTVATVDKMIGEEVSPDETPMDSTIVRNLKAGREKSSDQTDDEENNVVELAEDEYIEWDCNGKVTVSSDTEITGEVTRYVSSLASDQTRANKQSVFLVDGQFVKGDKLVVAAKPVNDANTEEYVIGIPDDGNVSHLVRYQMPENADTVKIYAGVGDIVDEVLTDTFGEYVTFTATGSDVHVRVEFKEAEDYTMLVVAIALIIFLVILVVVIVKVIHYRRTHKRPGSEKPINKLKSKISETFEVEDLDDEEGG